ncbi:MAG: hypothetical protein JNN29_14960, partial [Chitinophagaceae bacterium]|nr:hypothetical protein [Chitinophagaceae bacterium]
EIELLSANGQFLQLLDSRFLAKGEYVLPLSMRTKPAAGNYIVRIKSGLYANFVKFVVQ